jgi:hypothetical protein
MEASRHPISEVRSAGQTSLIVGPEAPEPWTVPDGASPDQYYMHLIGHAMMSDLLAITAPPGAEPGYEIHAAVAVKVCGYAHPSPKREIAARLAEILYPVHLGEPEFFAELRAAETSVPHAAAFDRILAGPSPVSPVDVMWCFSIYETAKRMAKISIDESRGTHRAVGSGYRCRKCDKNEAIIRPIQVNAGDEGNKFQVVCLNPSCREVEIME